MTKQQIICNGCGQGINRDGYSVSISAGDDDLGIDIKISIDTAWENHYCGKECLIRSLNGLVDKINGTAVLVHGSAPGGN